ncbi:MAG: hypothetical protein GY754_04840 [bacterium]|nr:hypothetical protein [bacterium]
MAEKRKVSWYAGGEKNGRVFSSQGLFDIKKYMQTSQTPGELDQFEAVNKFYSILASKKNPSITIQTKDCFAVRLGSLLIEIIDNNSFKLSEDGIFEQDFYDFCLEKIREHDLAAEVNDEELLLIYTKQTIIILKNSTIVSNHDGIAVVNGDEISNESLFVRLFYSLWSGTSWEHIFPSDPVSARELEKNKDILKDVLLKSNNKVKLDVLANEFFELTGFASKNDIILISFLDFYFFTWLKHFGIIRYFESSHNSPVFIELTDEGRILLNSIV